MRIVERRPRVALAVLTLPAALERRPPAGASGVSGRDDIAGRAPGRSPTLLTSLAPVSCRLRPTLADSTLACSCSITLLMVMCWWWYVGGGMLCMVRGAWCGYDLQQLTNLVGCLLD
jgi:hypothetical protein